MKLARIVNRTRGTVLCERARVADSFISRLLGLMGQRPLPLGAGLVLIPGGAVHNFFVFQSIDVVHVGRDRRVTHVIEPLRPWAIGPLFVGDAATVELPPGTSRASGTIAGDLVDIELLT